MTLEQVDLVRHRLVRGRESLEEARLLLESGHLNGCVNRLYYACFYAVTALLLTRELSSSKHSGVRSLFDREWVNKGDVPVESGRFYRRLFNSRQRSDYDDLVEFQEEEVTGWLEQAKEFIELLNGKVDAELRHQCDDQQ